MQVGVNNLKLLEMLHYFVKDIVPELFGDCGAVDVSCCDNCNPSPLRLVDWLTSFSVKGSTELADKLSGDFGSLNCTLQIIASNETYI